MRFLPNTDSERAEMCRAIGVASVDDLFADIPDEIRSRSGLNLPHGITELDLLREISDLAALNCDVSTFPIFMGAGSYDHFIPSVVRHVISRSEFLTPYTPYQPEVSQGTLQAMYEFQSMICALTDMELANASMYDGASALAEGVIMACEVTKRRRVLLPETLHPAYRRVVATYCGGLNLELISVHHSDGITDLAHVRQLLDESTAAIIVQQPNFYGCLELCDEISTMAHAIGALVIAVAYPISLGMLKPPGEYGADVAVGDGQSLGLPLSFGGPTFGYFACRRQFARHLPGRLVGATVDSEGNRGFVLTLQTREQHIRREKATSNICTSQQLCALAATVYLSALGPLGLKEVARCCYEKAHYAYEAITGVEGYEPLFQQPFFNEFAVRCPVPVEIIDQRLREKSIIGGLGLKRITPDFPDALLLCVTEKRTSDEIDRLVGVLADLAADQGRGKTGVENR